MLYHFKVHKEKDGYWAQGIELPGCFTQGKTLKELYSNMQEALNLYIEEPVFAYPGLPCLGKLRLAQPVDSDDLAALPDDSIKVTKTIIAVAVDPYHPECA